MSNAEHDYVTGQLRPTAAALLAEFESESQSATRFDGVELDVSYGPHARQKFDFFPAASADRTLVYFHAGYWQARDKRTFRFLGPALAASGLQVVTVNYPLCPEVRLSELVEATAAIVPALRARLGHQHPLVLSGHSAGAHLSTELAIRLQHETLCGVLAISGIYDLEPLVATSLNERLQLDYGQASDASPIHRVRPNLPKAVFAVGGTETEAFLEQNHRMADAWAGAGNESTEIVIPGADHFSVLRALSDSAGELHRLLVGER